MACFQAPGETLAVGFLVKGPMIASFFDSSNVTTADSGDLSSVLIVEEVPIVSNWLLERHFIKKCA